MTNKNLPKALTWLHISDIHFFPKLEWRDNASREALLSYLEGAFSNGEMPRPDLIFCTGDIAFGDTGSMPIADQYQMAKSFFDRLLKVCGDETEALDSDRLFVVPGNHDVNRRKINSDAQATMTSWAADSHAFSETVNQRFEDRPREFRDALTRLDDYADFVREHLPHQMDMDGRHTYAVIVEVNGMKVGIAGLNSAWTCAGPEDDRNLWLAAKWQFNRAKAMLEGSDLKIGLIHHPNDWLNTADRDVASTSIARSFDFWLHGHSHSAWVTPVQSHVVIAAGAIGAELSVEFGANLVHFDPSLGNGTVHLFSTKAGSHDWTIAPIGHHAPSGKWEFSLPRAVTPKRANGPVEPAIPDAVSTTPKIEIGEVGDQDLAKRHFARRMSESLMSFSSCSIDWVLPYLSTRPEVERDAKEAPALDLNKLIASPRSLIIKAPPQYGLTCLAHYLVKEAYAQPTRSIWLYLDARNLKPNTASIQKVMEDELHLVGKTKGDISCVILDSWSIRDDAVKLLKRVSAFFGSVPIICMQQIEVDTFADTDSAEIGRQFEVAYMWSLSRQKIREIVATYNEKKQIGDENVITARLVSDLDVLNLHRTPLNCITLLKVSELDFDESPVNRTEIIKRVLFLLFCVDDIPSYKSRPDIKDCEYVLGHFCEYLLKSGNYTFSRDKFLVEIQTCCQNQLIDLDTHVVFDVLYLNNIIIRRGSTFFFRFSYWIFYFAAQRMHQNPAFAEYIFQEMRYAQHPELMEFYTGIDRRREDALRVLIRDMRAVRSAVRDGCGLPETLNPYKFGTWKASAETQKRMQQEIATGVMDSKLPDAIKDQYADQAYDRRRPYNQAVNGILTEHSFVRMMQGIRAASRALRNSDYASLDLKRELLSEIMKCWEQASRVIFVVLPVLMEQRSAYYDGIHVVLNGDFGNTSEQRFINILSSIPRSLSGSFEDDLYSMKMGPLLMDHLKRHSADEISAHELILLIIGKRPREWAREVTRYISSVSPNSFYLLDVYSALRNEYKYAFASTQALKEIEHLIKMSATKHHLGDKRPGPKAINKMRFGADILPSRDAV